MKYIKKAIWIIFLSFLVCLMLKITINVVEYIQMKKITTDMTITALEAMKNGDVEQFAEIANENTNFLLDEEVYTYAEIQEEITERWKQNEGIIRFYGIDEENFDFTLII